MAHPAAPRVRYPGGDQGERLDQPDPGQVAAQAVVDSAAKGEHRRGAPIGTAGDGAVAQRPVMASPSRDCHV